MHITPRPGNIRKSVHPARFHTILSCPPFSTHCTPSILSCQGRCLLGGTYGRRDPAPSFCRFQLPRFRRCWFVSSTRQTHLSSPRSCSFIFEFWSIPPWKGSSGKSEGASGLKLADLSFLEVEALTPLTLWVNMYILSLFGVLSQSHESWRSMNDIGEKSWPKIKRKMMYFLSQRLLYQSHQPIHHIMLHQSRNHGILHRTFLKQSKAETLNNRSVLLIF